MCSENHFERCLIYFKGLKFISVLFTLNGVSSLTFNYLIIKVAGKQLHLFLLLPLIKKFEEANEYRPLFYSHPKGDNISEYKFLLERVTNLLLNHLTSLKDNFPLNILVFQNAAIGRPIDSIFKDLQTILKWFLNPFGSSLYRAYEFHSNFNVIT